MPEPHIHAKYEMAAFGGHFSSSFRKEYEFFLN